MRFIDASAAAPKAPNTAVLGSAAAPAARPIAVAAADAVSIAMDPTAVPKPLGQRAPQLVKYSIDTVELAGKLDDGTTFTYWTFDKKVPGPMLRVKKGDTIELTLRNAKSSKMIHSIDLHAVTGGHGGGEIFDKVYSEGSISSVRRDIQTTTVAPGGATIVDFKVDYPGKYLLVDHALSRVAKGLAASLEVTGPADSAVYQPMTPGARADH